MGNPYQPQRKMLSQIRKCVKYIDDPWSVAPSVVEISPSNQCNHKCSHCMYADSHDGAMLGTTHIMNLLSSLQKMEVPAIMWTGGGEPLLNKMAIFDGFITAEEYGIKQGLNTNGYYLDNDMVLAHVLDTQDWVRISLDAGTRKTYEKVHGVDHWDKVIANITNLVKKRDEMGSKCTIGVGFVASSKNWDTLTPSRIKLIKTQLNIDYVQIKPSVRSQDWSQSDIYASHSLSKNLESDNDYISATLYKWDAIGEERSYDYCGAAHFLSYVDANGDVYPCSSLQNWGNWVIGNIKLKSFEEIWFDWERQAKLTAMKHGGYVYCPQACRGNEINKFLWELTHSDVPHPEFI